MLSGTSVREERAGAGYWDYIFLYISSHCSKFSNLAYGMGLGVEEGTLYMKRQGLRADKGLLGSKHQEPAYR